jgi:uncharacterized protein (TIGR00730 family)
MPRLIRSVCVFCGSRPGDDPKFAAAGRALGAALAERKITLVYGGAKVGVMGALADGCLAKGGRVVGIIPKGLVSKEIAHDGLSELFLTETMFERKERMLTLSDAFVTLPGGFGTFDEFFETLTLSQIGFHDKPNALLDVDGFFDPLVALMEKTIRHEFAAAQHRGLVFVAKDANELLDRLATWEPPPLGEKWIDRRGTP